METHSTREIERKLIVGNGLNMPETDFLLTQLLNPTRLIQGESTDFYYRSKSDGFDFIRLRTFPDGSVELTGKKKDTSSNLNRLEINLTGMDSEATKAFAKAAFGSPIYQLTKKYSVFTPSFEPAVDVSTYVIEGVNEVFLEVEGKSETIVEKMVTALKRELALTDEPRSLYEMFVENRNTFGRLAGF